MAEFNPDQFIASQSQPTVESGFNPDSFIAQAEKEDKYGSGTEQIKAGLEGVANGIAGPLATGAELALGAKPEDIRGRAEVNPLTSGAAEATGLLGSAFIPGGQGRLLTKGAAAVATTAAKRLAVENALYAAGSEVSKMMLKDPNQSVGSAISNIGLSGMLGGALGKAGEKLSGLDESKLGRFIGDAKTRLQEHMELPGGVANIESLPNGAKAVDSLLKFGATKLGGAGIGGAIGHATGIPYGGTIGAVLGKEFGETALPTLAKAMFQNPVSTRAFKASTDYITAVVKGQTILNKAVDSVFKVGTKDIGDYLTPHEKSIDKVKEHLDDFGLDTSSIISKSDPIAHYMPDHAGALAAQLNQIVNYLKPLKPDTQKTSILGPDRVPSKTEEAKYQRALTLAESPLSVLLHIKSGTLTPFDTQSMSAMYPALTNALREKLVASMTKHLSGDQGAGAEAAIPFKTAMSLSLFLGMPLYSSIMPQDVLANQGVYNPPVDPQAPNQGQPGANGGGSGGNKSLTQVQAKGLQKVSQSTALPGQARELNKQSPNRK